MPRPPKRAQRHIDAAYKKAGALVRTSACRSGIQARCRSSPISGEDQAYSTSTGGFTSRSGAGL
jgi:hypothetical protein